MRFDQLTVKAAEAVQAAQELASSAGHAQIEPIHLLSALVNHGGDGGVVPAILERIGVRLEQLTQIVDRELARRPRAVGGQTVMSPQLQQVFDQAQKEADRLKDKFISSEHILLGLADVASDAKEALSIAAVTRDSILAAMKEVRGKQRVDTQNPEETYQALERYGRDLVELARRGKIDPVIGRDEEIRRIMQ